MKCKVCGAESGKYPLCKACNIKKQQGLIIRCPKCNKWHYKDAECPAAEEKADSSAAFLYEIRPLLSRNEQSYFAAIKSVLPEGYCVFPQIALVSIVDKTDNSRFHNELFRVIDFLVTDKSYIPKVVIEVNDQTHYDKDRKERDLKVSRILGESGIAVITLWTSYGVNAEYIGQKLKENLENPPERKLSPELRAESAEYAKRREENRPVIHVVQPTRQKKKSGCYIATAVYGSYDCPEVWTLRRFRDNNLKKSFFGRLFVKTYYAISPTIVKWFGKTELFNRFWKARLDRMVKRLNDKGYENTPYED